MEQTLPFLILLALGLLLQWLPVFPADTDRSLNLYVIYIALPALILLQVPKLRFSVEILGPILMPWLALACSALLTLLLCRFMHWSRETTGALLLVVPLGNTSFLGIPMVEQFFGHRAVSYALLYDQFGSFLALSTYGAFILAYYSPGTKTGFRPVIVKIVTFPPFIALTAALLLPISHYPKEIESLLSMASASLVPVVMVAIGFQMRLLLPLADLLPFSLGLFIKLLITPLLFILICRLLNLSGTAIQVSLFETAMPPMVTASALATIANLNPRLTSAMVGFGILFSFATLPLIYKWIQFYLN
ncbi:MAG: AEC family transporter [Desulfobulbaceae bacterium]|nr:AEC family transporter [Desulfobulbaceae bacterium]